MKLFLFYITFFDLHKRVKVFVRLQIYNGIGLLLWCQLCQKLNSKRWLGPGFWRTQDDLIGKIFSISSIVATSILDATRTFSVSHAYVTTTKFCKPYFNDWNWCCKVPTVLICFQSLPNRAVINWRMDSVTKFRSWICRRIYHMKFR